MNISDEFIGELVLHINEMIDYLKKEKCLNIDDLRYSENVFV